VWSSISMAHVKPLANAPYPRQKTSQRPIADWMSSVPLATQGASVGKLFVLALLSARLTAISGSARLATEATGSTEKNSARLWRLSVVTLLHTSCSRSAP